MMIGDNLRALLKERNMSARELAAAIGEPQKTVAEIIQKNRPPRDLTVVKKIAQALKVTTHEVLFGEKDPHADLEQATQKLQIHSGIYKIEVTKIQKD